MNIEENKNNLIRLYKEKSQNFQKILTPKNINIKKPLLKSKPFLISSLNHDLNTILDEQNSQENSKIFFYRNNAKLNRLILPSIPNTTTHIRTIMNSSTLSNPNNNSLLKPKKRYNVKLKKIKIKKNEERQSITPVNINKKLLVLYNEDFYLKNKFEKYKDKKADDIRNIKNFSYEKYNLHLLKLSSINLSQDSYNVFKKNMKVIENKMNGQKMKRKNRWLLFLDKIGHFAPEGLKRKIKSLSEHKKLEETKD